MSVKHLTKRRTRESELHTTFLSLTKAAVRADLSAADADKLDSVASELVLSRLVTAHINAGVEHAAAEKHILDHAAELSKIVATLPELAQAHADTDVAMKAYDASTVGEVARLKAMGSSNPNISAGEANDLVNRWQRYPNEREPGSQELKAKHLAAHRALQSALAAERELAGLESKHPHLFPDPKRDAGLLKSITGKLRSWAEVGFTESVSSH